MRIRSKKLCFLNAAIAVRINYDYGDIEPIIIADDGLEA